MSDTFLWGAATAAYQIEGATKEDGRGPSIWDTFAKLDGKVANGETGDIADDSYHKIHEDVLLMKTLGLQAYRFSISWSRILPLGYGEINQAGVDHYNTLIDAVLAAKMVPFVTLYHWDLPQGLEDKYGGLLSEKFEADFVHYADVCFRHFGDRVKKWVTINEPWTIAYLGYATGQHAPGRCSNRKVCSTGDSSTEPYIVAHNMLNAHAAVVEHYRQRYQSPQGGEIGIVLNLDWGEPLTRDYVDNAAAMRHNEFSLGWFADPIFFGRYPSTMRDGTTDRHANGTVIRTRLPHFTTAQRDRLVGSLDFLGMNHYSTKYYVDPGYDLRGYLGQDSLLLPINRHQIAEGGDAGKGWAWDQLAYSTKYDQRGQLIGPQGESGWLNMVPWGFYDVLLYVHNRYSIAYSNAKLARMGSLASADAGRSTQQSQSGATLRVAGGGRARAERLPIYVTENGCDAPGEAKMPLSQALRDSYRVQYLSSYITEMQRARRVAGVDVRGYFVWSLLDNFEWADGYDKRFGIVYVDYNSSARTRYLKDSARWYADYIVATGSAVPELLPPQPGRGRIGGAGGWGEATMGAVSGVGAQGEGGVLARSAFWSALGVFLMVLLLSLFTRHMKT